MSDYQLDHWDTFKNQSTTPKPCRPQVRLIPMGVKNNKRFYKVIYDGEDVGRLAKIDQHGSIFYRLFGDIISLDCRGQSARECLNRFFAWFDP
jgi:hypothetical protein